MFPSEWDRFRTMMSEQKESTEAILVQQLGSTGYELYDKIVGLSHDFAFRAATHDEEASFPVENYRKLHEAGLLALTIPQEYGGLGVDPLTHALCLLELAKACPSTALTFTMHTTVVTFIAALGNEEQKRRYFQEVRENGTCLASVTSEPGASFRDKFHMQTTLRHVDGGYQLQGLKHFCSIGRHAGLYFVAGKLEGSTTAEEGFLCAVIPKGPEVEVVGFWEERKPLGMRATCSDSIQFDAFVPHSNVVGAPGQLLASGLFARFPIAYAAVYLGIAEAALDFIVEHLESPGLPIIRKQANEQKTEEMRSTIEKARELLYDAGRAFTSGDQRAAVLAIAKAKIAGAEAGRKVTYQAMELAGGMSLFREALPLERWYRDATCGPIMPPSNNRCSEVIRRIEGGEDRVTLLEFA